MKATPHPRSWIKAPPTRATSPSLTEQRKITLSPNYQNVTVESGDKLGQLNVSGTAVLQTGRRRDEAHSGIRRDTPPFAYTSGNPVTVDGTETELTKVDGGKYHYGLRRSDTGRIQQTQHGHGDPHRHQDHTAHQMGQKTCRLSTKGNRRHRQQVRTPSPGRLPATSPSRMPPAKKSVTVPVEVDVTADRAQDKASPANRDPHQR